MWPMLIALSTFYPEGVIGYFIDNENKIGWYKKSNEIFYKEKSQNERFHYPSIDYNLKNSNLKLAILLSRQTSNSGEAIAISLKSVGQTKYFGENTSGYSTANETIKLAERENI